MLENKGNLQQWVVKTFTWKIVKKGSVHLLEVIEDFSWNELFTESFDFHLIAGSGYSPSFFHFKPIKYGVMNGKSGMSKQHHQQQQAAVSDGESLQMFPY